MEEDKVSLEASDSYESLNATDSEGQDVAENNLVSERFRHRMQPCPQPVMERVNCPCCGRNFRDARAALDKFRETILAEVNGAHKKPAPTPGGGAAAEFSENERCTMMSDNFLCRLLARCGCNVKQAQERFWVALAVHRKYSLNERLLCSPCLTRPGYHSFRQVGFDRLGRPVLYTCLNQDLETGTQPPQVKDYFLHLIRTIQEAEKTIPESQHSLVMVFDTTGLSMSHVRPDTVGQFGEMLRYFPARLCYALLLNLSGVTRFLLKPVIHLTGHKNDIMALGGQDLEKQLAECFDQPLARWMVQEIEVNKRPKMPFYQAPPASAVDPHDSRGEPSYVANYVARSHVSGHQPHASILAALNSNKTESK